MVAGIKNAMIPADQFLLGVLTDGAELFVYVGDYALDVSYGYDGVLIQSELLIGQLLEGSLGGGQAFL